ncbi:MAG: FUSC family protein [Segniliparus sp.]|uniref:FUSC family protein n=1 Tax=Segniliparus sp. TaxID=2804064 RepID=UPI003F377206
MRDWIAALRPGPSAAPAAVRSALAVGVPLFAVIGIGHPEWALFVVCGSFTAVYGRDENPRQRFFTQLSAALALVVATVLGAALTLSQTPLLVIALGGVLAAAGSLCSALMRWLPPGPLFVVLSFASCADISGKTGATVLVAALVVSATALWSLSLGLVGVLRVGLASAGPGARRPRWQALRDRTALDRAAWCALAVAVAGALSVLTIGRHTGWAMVAATAPFAGGTLKASVRRGVHRVVGTFFGSGIALAVLSMNPREYLAVVIIMAAQGLAELFVVQHYAFALLFITPSALIGVRLTSASPVQLLLHDRLFDTAIGACVGVGVLVAAHALAGRRQSAA